MSEEAKFSTAARGLFIGACFVIVVAGMKASADLIVPFLLAMFIAVICSPIMSWLRAKKVPAGLAVILILIMIISVSSFIGVYVGSSVNNFVNNLDAYNARLTEKTGALVTWLGGKGVELSQDTIGEYFNPGTAMKVAGTTLSSLSGMLTNTFLILLTVVFILLEAAGFPDKIRAARAGDAQTSLRQLAAVKETLNHYLALKTLFSLITGVLIWVWLSILGVDYPVLWGLLAFLLNFIPNIGSIIAAVPAVLLALVQLSGMSALLTAAGYLVANFAIGSVCEPRFMGQNLGLSTLVVFISLVFWGWVLGPVGMLLSVPLTMCLKIVLESYDDTRWIAVMLGSGQSLPKES